MTRAQSIISYYESNDFKNQYKDVLYESFLNDEDIIIERICDALNYYNLDGYFTPKGYVGSILGEQIYNHIKDNFDDFVTDFNGYYVGYYSIDSIEFGEQEEQIEQNEIEEFENAGFVVNKKTLYVYYIPSGGLHVTLKGNIEEINNILNEFPY